MIIFDGQLVYARERQQQSVAEKKKKDENEARASLSVRLHS